MTSYFEQLIDKMGNVPQNSSKALADIRELDKWSTQAISSLNSEESRLMEEMKSILKNNATFDEDKIINQMLAFRKRREDIIRSTTEQAKKANLLYDQVNAYIRILDADMKIIECSLPDKRRNSEMRGSSRPTGRPRKKKDSTAAASTSTGTPLSVAASTPGAPMDTGIEEGDDNGVELYCYCRTPSHGDMIACEDPNCPTPEEWYHFSCVGLPPEFDGKWVCNICKQKNEENETSN